MGIQICIKNMSVSPFHGGLVFRESLVDSSYPT